MCCWGGIQSRIGEVLRCGGDDDDDLPSMRFLDFLVKLGTGIGIQMVEEDKTTVYPLLLVSYLRTRRVAGVGIYLFYFILLMRKLILHHRC